jgi:sporulation protein YlmC with PRC-barrel domain
MRQIPLAATAVLAILTGVAAAQTTTTPRPSTPAPSAATAPAPRAPAVNPLTKEAVSAIEGTSVYGNDNDKLGHVSEVLMDPSSKKIDRLVVTSGGVLGVGGHRVAVPIDQFKWDGNKDAFILAMTTAELKSKPEWVDGATTATGSTMPPRTEKPITGAGDGEKK